jgi:AcrR family transcriptional regulator
MAELVRPYRGVSARDRTSERRARLKSACLDVVSERGVPEVTVEAVAVSAGLTKRYFYESFTDLDGLLGELIDDIFTELLEEILHALGATGGAVPPAAVPPAGDAPAGDAPAGATRVGAMLPPTGDDLERRARTINTCLIDFLGRDVRRARLYIEAPGQATLRARREEAYGTYTRLLLDHLPTGRGAPPRDEDRRALAALIVVAGVTQAAVTWLRGTVPLDRNEIIDELTRVMVAALR